MADSSSPAVKASVTVTIEMTTEQRKRYDEKYGAGFVGPELSARLGPELRAAMSCTPWLDWLAGNATVTISAPPRPPRKTPPGPPSSWTCDTCGEPITDPARGLVVWRIEDGIYTDFRIVHKTFRSEPDPRDCDPGDEAGYTMNLELDNYLGPDGLTMLLGCLSNGPLMGGGPASLNPVDLDSFTDLVRRVQIPDYERARPRFRDDRIREAFADANAWSPYRQDILSRIADGKIR